MESFRHFRTSNESVNLLLIVYAKTTQQIQLAYHQYQTYKTSKKII